MRPWKTRKSTYLHRDKWLTLRADACETSGGVEIAPYYVFEYADWVNIVALNSAGRVMLVWQYRHAVGQVCAELPCGVIEEGEDPETAARRELAEETGVTASMFELVSSLNPNSATHTNRVHCFLARDAEITLAPSPDATEEIASRFVPIEEVMAMLDDGRFCQSQHVASLMMGLRRAGVL